MGEDARESKNSRFLFPHYVKPSDLFLVGDSYAKPYTSNAPPPASVRWRTKFAGFQPFSYQNDADPRLKLDLAN